LDCITETKGHPYKLEKTKWSNHSCLEDIFRSYWYLVIDPGEINYSENGSSLEGGGEVMDMGYGVVAGSSTTVDGTIIPIVVPFP
jgi:hypothetical protein